MPKKRISPHDRFIRALMTHPKVIHEFFDTHLPENVKKIIDLSKIEVQKESFIDDKLNLQIADLLYSVEFQGEAGYLYILMEHASVSDKLLPFRILKYMIAIMDHHLKITGDHKLPFIYPLILYTGEKAYPHSMNLFDLFKEQKDLALTTLTSAYQLIDLTQVTDQELKKYMWFGTMALVAKHIRDIDILPTLKNIIKTLKVIEEEGEEGYIYTVISYVAVAGDSSSKEEFINTVKELEFINEDKIMTIAEQLKPEVFQRGLEKGIEQGIEQGIEKGKIYAAHEIAVKLVQLGLTTEEIEQVTTLTPFEVEKLKRQAH